MADSRMITPGRWRCNHPAAGGAACGGPARAARRCLGSGPLCLLIATACEILFSRVDWQQVAERLVEHVADTPEPIIVAAGGQAGRESGQVGIAANDRAPGVHVTLGAFLFVRLGVLLVAVPSANPAPEAFPGEVFESGSRNGSGKPLAEKGLEGRPLQRTSEQGED
jgi:hypothetical protein